MGEIGGGGGGGGGGDDDPLFADAAWRAWETIRLSTSTLASPALEGGGFGPVGEEAYGVGYGLAEEGCAFHVSTFRGATTTDGEAFCHELERALRDVRDAL
jgi:hypothetical protein